MVKQRMLIAVGAFALGALVLGAGLGLGQRTDTQVPPANAVRTVFLVRHGDTAPQPGEQDPKLTEAGEARAARLAEVLRDEPMGAIFVTRTTRSLQTGTPTAEFNGIEPTVYLPTGYDDLRAKVLAEPGGSSCVVVAHSNTVPGIVEAFGGREMDELPEKEFDRLIVLMLSGETLQRMVELRY